MKISKSAVLDELISRGWTFTKLSNASSIPLSTISRLLSRGSCNHVTLGRMAKALGIPAAKLVGK